MKDKELFWRRQIEKQQTSSLAIQTYCDRHKLSSGMFYYWKRKTEVKSTAEQFAEIQIINGEVTTGVIHVRFPSGVEISLENDPGTAYLRSLAGLVVSN